MNNNNSAQSAPVRPGLRPAPTSLIPYPAYRDSGVPWLGAIPAHWKIKPLKYWVKINAKTLPETTAPDYEFRYIDIGAVSTGFLLEQPQRLRFADSPSRARRIVQKDDTIISTVRTYLKAVYFVEQAEEDLVASTGFAVLSPGHDVVPKYLSFLVQSDPFTNRVSADSVGIAYPAISETKVAAFHVAMPPAAEQAAIVRYLDHADRRIRRYIAARRKLIALLNEQKQAIIHRAVTRGLDPNVRLKPSGVEWLGDIPEHWEVRRLRTLVQRIEQGVSPQAEALLADENSWGVLKAGCVNGGMFRESEHKRLPDGFSIDPNIAVQVGDVLISRASGSPKLVGSVGKVQSLSHRLILSDKTFRPVFKDTRIVDFVVAAMNTRYFRIQVEQAISGAEGLANNLPLSELKNFVLAVPPTMEAVTIAEFLQDELRCAQQIIDRTNREIELIREYRTRLIADVVTGKLDVRAAAAALPDEDAMPDAYADALAEEDDAEAEDGAEAIESADEM